MQTDRPMRPLLAGGEESNDY